MASTYSTNLRLELIGTGEQQGTWGGTTNINLGTLLEQAIGGYESVTVSNVADTTLTTANGSADQARNMTLNLVGTISATRNVICPAIEKIYIVKNATSGGFAVTFKVTGQTGVSIPNGSTVIVYVDGIDARLVSQFPVPITQGGTGASTATGSGSVVLATSPTLVTPNLGTPSAAVLTSATGLPLTTGVTGTLPVANGGTGVTTSTGSGNNVLSTSPVLTTPNLGTPSAVVLTSATGLPLTTGVTGTLPVANGGTGTTTSTGTGSAVLSAGPALTGTPTAPTAAVDTNTTQIATTAFVVAQAGSTTPVVDGTAAVGTSLRYARADHVHPTDTSRAALASPTFTGTPAAPTAAVDTNTTQIATTAYVVGQGYAKLSSPALTGTPTAPTAAVDTSTTQLATTAYVVGQGYLKSATASSTYAPLASPGLTGTPTAPTAASGTNTTQIATTAFVTGAITGSRTTYNSGSGNYTIPANASFIFVRLWGGGGSGQNNPGGINTNGGSGGSYAERLYTVGDLGGSGASVAYSVGAGGAAVAANVAANGNNGGNSTFGSGGNLITAYGGSGANTGTWGPGVFGIGTLGGSTVANGNAAFPWGGGGGGGTNTNPGGDSVYGGSGGGGGNTTSGIGTGGLTLFGGVGGTAGNSTTAATSGSAPGGGGGGTRSTTTPSGAGGAGRIEVYAW